MIRPTHEGWWFYRSKKSLMSDAKDKVVRVATGYSKTGLCVIDGDITKMSVFECQSDFDYWIGEARPQKKLKKRGDYVLYSDVEEFDLKDE